MSETRAPIDERQEASIAQEGEANRRLRERLDEPNPEPWFQEKEGDTFVGTLIRYDRGMTRRAQRSTIVVAAQDDGKERSIWLLHSMLFSVFARERPQPGERFALRYDGDAVSESSGNTDAVWKLVVDRPGEGGGISMDDALGAPGEHDQARVEQANTVPHEDVQVERDDIPF